RTLERGNGAFNGTYLIRNPNMLPPENLEMIRQDPHLAGRLLILRAEHVANCVEPETQLPQQQDSLQPYESGVVVVAVTAMADATGGDEADTVVVTERARGRTHRARDVLNRVLHVSPSVP